MRFDIFLVAAFAAVAMAFDKPVANHPECKPCRSTYTRCAANCYLIGLPAEGIKPCQENCKGEAANLMPVCKTDPCLIKTPTTAAPAPQHPECEPCFDNFVDCRQDCRNLKSGPELMKDCEDKCREKTPEVADVCKTEPCKIPGWVRG